MTRFSATGSVRNGARSRELDGLRGVAIGVVIVYHAFPNRVPGGFVGVDLFFALSGFLITSLLLAERGESGRISLGRFYGRRILRLYPALLVLLGGLLLLSAVTRFGSGWASGVFAVMTYRSNFTLAAGHGLPPALEHTWSLSFEEQFYLLWPGVLVLLLRTRRPAMIMAITAALAATSAALRAGLWTAGHGQASLYFGPLTHADPILMGCLAAEAYFWYPRLLAGRRWLMAAGHWLPAAVLVLFVARLHSGSPLTYTAGLAVASVAFALAVWSLAQGPAGALGAFVRSPALVRLGAISYSVYLWHYPLMVWTHEHVGGAGRLGPVLAVGASLLAGELSYRVVERPCLALKSRLAGIRTGRGTGEEGPAPVPAGRPEVLSARAFG